MRSKEFLREYYEETDDKYTVINIDHVRRPRITLRHLQKLRKTQSIEELEHANRVQSLGRIYGSNPEE